MNDGAQYSPAHHLNEIGSLIGATHASEALPKLRELLAERNALAEQVCDRDEIIRMLTFQNNHSMWTLHWQQVQAHTNPRVRALMVSKRGG